MRIALDVETECAVPDCEKKGKGCEHALDAHRNRISVIGLYYVCADGEVARTFRNICHLRDFLENIGPYSLCFHNGKFDLRTLAVHGLNLSDKWQDDTLLMAATSTDKISKEWLDWYEAKRKQLNEDLPRGVSHRVGSVHSLKSLAPYFLHVPPFWEHPGHHDNDEYVVTDCRYTYELAALFEEKLKEEGSYEFYKNKFIPWAKLLLKMEQRGVALDLALLEEEDSRARAQAAEAKAKLDVLWADAYKAYFELAKQELRAEYDEKLKAALAKLPPSAPELRKEKARKRYEELYQKACTKLPAECNLDSPSQLSWLLRDYLKLDITNFHGEETTGKPVLKKLADREDVSTYLRYRQQQKLTQAFFPSYREMNVAGTLHPSFNATGTRTGRLSCSSPNLQQVAGSLHKLFVARPGFRLATYDMSAIEPRLIAYYTADANLFTIVKSGDDFHGHTTKVLFEADWPVESVKTEHALERKMGKEVGLSLFYGAGASRLQETAQKYGFQWDERECRRKLERFKEYYKGVYTFRDEYVNPLLQSGQVLTNILGRPFSIPDPSDVHMQGFNTLIQGSASDLVLNSALRMQTRFEEEGIDAHVLLLVHDEVVVEIAEEHAEHCVQIIKEAMTGYTLECALGRVPLLVEGKIADRWEK